jgi:Flp pilus assembly pilin Flp
MLTYVYSKSVFYFLASRRGATAIEYSLIAAAIAVAISVVVFAFGEDLQGLIESLTGMLTSG